MPLFGNRYKPLLDAYERLLATERANHTDEKERWIKERSELLDKLMTLTNPVAVRTANSTIHRVGTIRSAPPEFGAAGIPEEYDLPDFPEGMPDRRPSNPRAAINVALQADIERTRKLAEARREAQDAASLEKQPS